jgi:preprotein translocase subunit SecG
METIVIVVHLLVALAIIGLILMQQGKGAEAGASFGGGASQTVFGSQGGSNFFARATGVLAFVFFATSFSLAIIAKEKTDINADEGIPSVIEQSAIESEIPVVPASESVEKTLESELPTVIQDAVNESAPVK